MMLNPLVHVMVCAHGMTYAGMCVCNSTCLQTSTALGMPKHTHLKWLYKFVTFMDASQHAKNQFHIATHSFDKAEPLFGITLGF